MLRAASFHFPSRSHGCLPACAVAVGERAAHSQGESPRLIVAYNAHFGLTVGALPMLQVTRMESIWFRTTLPFHLRYSVY